MQEHTRTEIGKLVRIGGAAAIVSGGFILIIHALETAFSWGNPPGSKATDYLQEGVRGLQSAIGLVTLYTIWLLHRRLSNRWGWLGNIGATLGFISSAAVILKGSGLVVQYFVLGPEAIGSVSAQWLQNIWGTLFLSAMLTGLLSNVILGIAVARGRVLPRWFGMLMALSFLIIGLFNAPGLELGWLANTAIAFITGALLFSYGNRIASSRLMPQSLGAEAEQLVV
jgi:hypothetical protein